VNTTDFIAAAALCPLGVATVLAALGSVALALSGSARCTSPCGGRFWAGSRAMVIRRGQLEEGVRPVALFEYLCERNAVTHNPVKGVKRPAAPGGEGRTPALGDQQARQLLEAPVGQTLKARRDRAMLATLLYHGLRRPRGTPAR
jgi:hypothetical protein